MTCQRCGRSLVQGQPACAGCGTPVGMAAPPSSFGPYAPAPGYPPGTGPLGEARKEMKNKSAERMAEIGLSTYRPRRFGSAAGWIIAGAMRTPRGAVAALVGAWSNLPIAIALAASGAVGGAIAGAIGGSREATDIPLFGDIIPTGMLQVGGILGALLGVAGGAVLGFYKGLTWPWTLVAHDSPRQALSIAIGQVFAGIVYTLGTIAFEPLTLRISGARRLSRREAKLIMPIVRECAERMGIDGLPRVLIDDQRDVNAYALTRHLVINHGLLDEFNYDREVLAGVISHELTHWNNADPVAAAFVRGMALPLYLFYSATCWLVDHIRQPLARIALWIFTWPAAVTVRFFIMPIQAAELRDAEYRSDRGAVLAGHRDGIRRALARMRRTLDGGRSGWDISACATHPPYELRLEALEEPGKSYPLPDPDAPAAPPSSAPRSSLEKD
jgi:Zn-dependent protease with chaperone function